MTRQERTRDELVAYLLGEASAERAEALESALFADDELFEELRMTEAELYDDYAAGQLSQRRRARFETRYLRTSEDRERLRFAAAMHRRANAVAAPDADAARPRRSGWLGRWLRPAMAAAAVATVLVLFVVLRGDAPESASRQIVVLGEEAVRGEQSVTPLPAADEIVLELRGHPASGLRARLLRGDRVVAHPPVSVEEGRGRIVLRPGELEPGIYALELSRGDGDAREILGYYSLQVE